MLSYASGVFEFRSLFFPYQLGNTVESIPHKPEKKPENIPEHWLVKKPARSSSIAGKTPVFIPKVKQVKQPKAEQPKQ